MKITIIYDNIAYNGSLKTDWGFSCLAETDSRTILFDTGRKGDNLLDNMTKLDIDPSLIDDVFISHNHFDHTGGLSSFLQENNRVNIYVPPSLQEVQGAKELIHVDQPMQLHKNIYSTGELDCVEQSLTVSTSKGLVLIVGCSHPKMKHILDTASRFGEFYGIIGGLHGFNEYELLKDFDMICPTHCTQHIPEIKLRYPEKYIEGGAGRIIEI